MRDRKFWLQTNKFCKGGKYPENNSAAKYIPASAYSD